MVASKKGFMRTLEVVIAVLLTFSFSIFLIPHTSDSFQQEGINLAITDNTQLRSCVLSRNVSCASDILETKIPSSYDYRVLISDTYASSASDLPNKDIFRFGYFYSANTTYYNPSFLTVLYWQK